MAELGGWFEDLQLHEELRKGRSGALSSQARIIDRKDAGKTRGPSCFFLFFPAGRSTAKAEIGAVPPPGLGSGVRRSSVCKEESELWHCQHGQPMRCARGRSVAWRNRNSVSPCTCFGLCGRFWKSGSELLAGRQQLHRFAKRHPTSFCRAKAAGCGVGVPAGEWVPCPAPTLRCRGAASRPSRKPTGLSQGTRVIIQGSARGDASRAGCEALPSRS